VWAARFHNLRTCPGVAGFPEDLRAVFRALAEARDGPFYALWVHLTGVWPRPLPTLGFRILQVADSEDAILGVWVSGERPDGYEVGWALSLTATPSTWPRPSSWCNSTASSCPQLAATSSPLTSSSASPSITSSRAFASDSGLM
jgi:hypothetical protein